LNRADGLELLERREKNIIDLSHMYLRPNRHVYGSNSLANTDALPQMHKVKI
jgi:hypothetical protein